MLSDKNIDEADQTLEEEAAGSVKRSIVDNSEVVSIAQLKKQLSPDGSHKMFKMHSRSKSVINPTAATRIKARDAPKVPRFGQDLALNRYIESALKEYKKDIMANEWQGPQYSTTITARRPIDGVKMAKERNRLRKQSRTD